MEVIPAMRVARFEQLEPGELFLCVDGRDPFYAIKTQKPSSGDRNEMVLLGPKFVHDVTESFLVAWAPVTVLSFGKTFTIVLPNDPASWSVTGPSREPLCLAISGDSTYICTNGGDSPQRYFPCFVDVKTGAIIERRLPEVAAFTNTWEIAALGADHLPRAILKFPLESAARAPQ